MPKKKNRHKTTSHHDQLSTKSSTLSFSNEATQAFLNWEKAWKPLLNTPESPSHYCLHTRATMEEKQQLIATSQYLVAQIQRFTTIRNLSKKTIQSQAEILSAALTQHIDILFIQKINTNKKSDHQENHQKIELLDQLATATTLSLIKGATDNIVEKLTIINTILLSSVSITTAPAREEDINVKSFPITASHDNDSHESNKSRQETIILQLSQLTLINCHQPNYAASIDTIKRIATNKAPPTKQHITQLRDFIEKFCQHNEEIAPDTKKKTSLINAIHQLNLPDNLSFFKLVFRKLSKTIPQQEKPEQKVYDSHQEDMEALALAIQGQPPTEKKTRNQKKKEKAKNKLKQNAHLMNKSALTIQTAARKKLANLATSKLRYEKTAHTCAMIIQKTTKGFIKPILDEKKKQQHLALRAAARTIETYIIQYGARQQHNKQQALQKKQQQSATLMAAHTRQLIAKNKASELHHHHYAWFYSLNPYTQIAAIAIKQLICSCCSDTSSILFGSRLLENTRLEPTYVNHTTDLDLLTLLPNTTCHSKTLSLNTFLQQLKHMIISSPSFQFSNKEASTFCLPDGQGNIMNCEILHTLYAPSTEPITTAIDLTFIQPTERQTIQAHMQSKLIPSDRFSAPVPLVRKQCPDLSLASCDKKEQLVQALTNPSYPDNIPATKNNIRNLVKKLIRLPITRQHAITPLQHITFPTLVQTPYKPLSIQLFKSIVMKEIQILLFNKPELLENLLANNKLNAFYSSLLALNFHDGKSLRPLDISFIYDSIILMTSPHHCVDFEIQHHRFLAESLQHIPHLAHQHKIHIISRTINYLERMCSSIINTHYLHELHFIFSVIKVSHFPYAASNPILSQQLLQLENCLTYTEQLSLTPATPYSMRFFQPTPLTDANHHVTSSSLTNNPSN